MKKLLNFKETAEMLNISHSLLRKLVAENKIPFIVIQKGKRKRLIRFSEEDILKYLKEKTQVEKK